MAKTNERLIPASIKIHESESEVLVDRFWCIVNWPWPAHNYTDKDWVCWTSRPRQSLAAINRAARRYAKLNNLKLIWE